MKRLLIALAGLTLSAAAFANEGAALPFSFKPDTTNLQEKGAAAVAGLVAEAIKADAALAGLAAYLK